MIDIKVFTFDTKDLKKSKNGLQRLLKKGYEVKSTLVVNDVVIYTLSTNVDDVRDFILKHVPIGAERTKVKKYWVDRAILSCQRSKKDFCNDKAREDMYKDLEYAFGSKNRFYAMYIIDAVTEKDKVYGKDKPVEEYYPALGFFGFDIEELEK